MDSQYENNKCLFLAKNRNFLNEIVNMEKFKKLDSRYMVADLCREMNLKYEFKLDNCNVYSQSFVLNILFDGLNLKSIACFIDQEFLTDNDQKKFVLFLRDVVKDDVLNISPKYLRGIFNSGVKEVKNVNGKCEFYARKILIDNREKFFMMIKLNA